MTLTVTHINVPAMSTIGYGKGTDDDGHEVCFIGDHRPMRHIYHALMNGETVQIEPEEWQIGWSW